MHWLRRQTARPVPGAAGAVFVSRRAKGEFWLFCGATFLAFLTTSTISYLSVILASLGMGAGAIGGVLSSPLVPVTAAILLSGYLIDRWSALPVALVGQVITLIAFVSFQLTVFDAWAAAGSRIVLGVGFGLFFPAAMVYAKSKLHGPQTAHLFGIYSSMVPLPNVLGPGLAEWYFGTFGLRLFFGVLALPLVVGFGMMLTLDRERRGPQGVGTPREGYGSLLARRTLVAPNVSIFSVGLVWGFVISFMALLLHRRGVPTPFFFSTTTATLILCRFTLLRYLSARPRELVVALGLGLMGLAYLMVFPTDDRAIVAAGGIVFGLGYSMAFPILSVWVSDQFKAEERGKPVALFSALFHAGIFLMPLVVGVLSRFVSLDALLVILAALAMLVGAALVGHWLMPAPAEEQRGAAARQAPG